MSDKPLAEKAQQCANPECDHDRTIPSPGCALRGRDQVDVTPPIGASAPETAQPVILCETAGTCTCGAPATTPRGMHHDYCGVRVPPGAES